MGTGSSPAQGDDDAAPTGTGEGSGGGGGGGAEPVGYVEIGPDGATFRPIEDANQMPSAALVLAAGVAAALILRGVAKLLRG